MLHYIYTRPIGWGRWGHGAGAHRLGRCGGAHWRKALAAGQSAACGRSAYGDRLCDRAQPLRGRLWYHPYPICRYRRCSPAVGILPRDADEHISLLPSGLTLSNALPQKWHRWVRIALTTPVGCILSAGIEYAQYRYALGMAEVDDVICNTLGAFMARSSVPPRCS